MSASAGAQPPNDVRAVMASRGEQPAAHADMGLPDRLRRNDFITACEALMADGGAAPGTTTGLAVDLSALFDILDPQQTGAVSLREFNMLLRAHHHGETPFLDAAEVSDDAAAGHPHPTPGVAHPAKADAPRADAAGGVSGGSGPLPSLRLWMLQEDWVLQDLVKLLGGLGRQLPLPELRARLLSAIHPPWLTPLSVTEIFRQLHVRCMLEGGEVAEAVRVPDLVEALIDCKTFVAQIACRVVRLLFRESWQRGVDVSRACQVADFRRTGMLDFPQLVQVLGELCPGRLAEADMALLFGSLDPTGACIQYEQLLLRVRAERDAAARHVLTRALPALQQQAGFFEEYARQHDARRSGALTATQLRGALAQLDLGLSQDPIDELDLFVEVLVAAAGQREREAFDYTAVVLDGALALSLEEALANIGGTAPAPAAAPPCAEAAPPVPDTAPRRHVLAIFFYRTAEAAARLELSAAEVFRRLDRGGKGHLSAEDLRAAVRDVLGSDEALPDLGLEPSDTMALADFELKVDFGFHTLEKTLPSVFAGEGSITEEVFRSRLQEQGIHETTASVWLQLMYPAGVPPSHVERRFCETFLATTPSVVLGPRHGASLRALARAQVELSGREWLTRPEASALLAARLPACAVEELLDHVCAASAYYPRSAASTAGVAEAALRMETLLSCTEACVEHRLEVRLRSLVGAPAVGQEDKPLEAVLRYRCHGTDSVAETTASGASVDLVATHTFGLSQEDRLWDLFSGVSDAFVVRIWAASPAERRLVAVARWPAMELRRLLERAEAHGSRAAFRLGLLAPEGELEIPGGFVEGDVLYSARPQDPPPLPWATSFAGRRVVCQRLAPGEPDTPPPEPTAPAPPAPEPEPPAPEPEAKPKPGSAEVELRLAGLALQAPLRGVVGPILGPIGSSLGLFVRFCLFARSPPAASAWAQTQVVALEGDVFSDSVLSAHRRVDFAYVWRSDALDASGVIAALHDSVAVFELWLRIGCASEPDASKLAADVRLAEKTAPLMELLTATSPQETGQLRLRMLQPKTVEATIAFTRDDLPFAELSAAIALELPSGPSVSWMLPAEPPPAEPPAPAPPPCEPPPRVDYLVCLKRALLADGLAQDKDKEAAQPLFYAELKEAGEASGPPVRSAPVRPVQGGCPGGWWLLQFGDATLSLPAPDGEAHHGGRVLARLLQPPGGAALEAVAQLPVGAAEGAPGPHFCGHVWLPLRRAEAVVGRLLLWVEARDPAGSPSPPPSAPSGIFLPLGEAVAAGDWALSAALRAFVGDGPWLKLAAAEAGCPGIVPAGDLEAALEEQGWRAELAFLRSSVPALFVGARKAPYAQLLAWLAVRQLAATILPFAAPMWARLRELDAALYRSAEGAGGGSGIVPLSSFQEALRQELAACGGELPAALWAMIAQRPQWSIGGDRFLGHAAFDYLVFFEDLHAALQDGKLYAATAITPVVEPVAPAPAEVAAAAPLAEAGSDGPSVMLNISSALRLPCGLDGEPPCAFVSYAWRDTPEERLGCTEVRPCSSNPSWEYAAKLALPAGVYPRAFLGLALEMRVWHAPAEGDHELIGLAHLDLTPLQLGFALVDGYFHILPAGADASASLGQLRASVVPKWDDAEGICAAPLEAAPAYRPRLTPSRPAPRAWSPEADTTLPPPGAWQAAAELPPALEAPRSPSPEAVAPVAEEPPELPQALRAPPEASHEQPSSEVSETALRMAARMCDVELALHSLEGTAEEQLEVLRARHRRNLESLERLQLQMLPPIPARHAAFGGAAAPMPDVAALLVSLARGPAPAMESEGSHGSAAGESTAHFEGGPCQAPAGPAHESPCARV